VAARIGTFQFLKQRAQDSCTAGQLTVASMNDEEEEYAYSDAEDDDDDEGETDGDEAEGGESSLKKRRSESTSGAASANVSTTSILREGSDEVRVLTEADLKALMDAVVAEISGVMDIPAEAATALLRYFSWNSEKLYDQFYSDPESVTAKVGIGRVGDEAAQLSGTITCRICCDDVPGNEAFALPCKHYFCTECWTGYLSTKVGEGPTCVFTTCPEHKCPQIVSEGVFRARLDDATFAKYEVLFVNIAAVLL
jgi:ariadne-1